MNNIRVSLDFRKSNKILEKFYGKEIWNKYNHEYLRFVFERYRVANEKQRKKILKGAF